MSTSNANSPRPFFNAANTRLADLQARAQLSDCDYKSGARLGGFAQSLRIDAATDAGSRPLEHQREHFGGRVGEHSLQGTGFPPAPELSLQTQRRAPRFLSQQGRGVSGPSQGSFPQSAFAHDLIVNRAQSILQRMQVLVEFREFDVRPNLSHEFAGITQSLADDPQPMQSRDVVAPTWDRFHKTMQFGEESPRELPSGASGALAHSQLFDDSLRSSFKAVFVAQPLSQFSDSWLERFTMLTDRSPQRTVAL